MKQTLVVFSTFIEAEATLKALKLSLDAPFIKTSFGAILISGMGTLNTYQALSEHASKKYTNLILLGVAGALKNSHVIGELLTVNAVFKYLPTPLWKLSYQKSFHQSLYPPFFLSSQDEKDSVNIICSDYPLHQREEKQLLSAHFNIVDMESYAFAKYATTYCFPYQIYKIVSDTPAKGGGEGEIVHRIKNSLSAKLYQCLVDTLD